MTLIARHAISLVSLFLIAAAAAFSLIAPAPQTPELDALVGKRVVLEGVIIEDPDVREKMALLTTKTEIGTVLVRVDRFLQASYGDVIRVDGKIELPKEFETDTGRTFNYPMYLRAHGVTHTMSFAHVAVLGHGEGNWLIAKLLALKHHFVSGMERALPEPESALLAGLLVGEKRGLGEELTESFRRAGVVHIIVLSGYNVALVIETMRNGLVAVLPRTTALTGAGVAAVAFMFMTGASETAVRATLMALVFLVAKALHRPAAGIRILLFVAAAMAVWNPYLVLFDLSYQLSVLATLGLVLLSNPIAQYLLWLRNKTLIEIVSTSIATQVAVLPLLIISIGQVSLVSLLANILVLIAVPYAMLAGFVAALMALASPELAFPFSALAYGLLTYIVNVAEFLGSLPYAAVHLPS